MSVAFYNSWNLQNSPFFPHQSESQVSPSQEHYVLCLFYVCGGFACICLCAPPMCLVPMRSEEDTGTKYHNQHGSDQPCGPCSLSSEVLSPKDCLSQCWALSWTLMSSHPHAGQNPADMFSSLPIVPRLECFMAGVNLLCWNSQSVPPPSWLSPPLEQYGYIEKFIEPSAR